jgi:hypothetical protein
MSSAPTTICNRLFIEGFRAVLCLCFVLACASNALAEKPMNGLVSITVKSKSSTYLGGPIPAVVTLANVSPVPVSVSLPFPNPNNLEFTCKTEGAAVAKKVERQEIERTAPITIAPGATYSTTYFLNRYMRFIRPGRAEIECQLSTLVGSKSREGKDEYHKETFVRQFQVELVDASADKLRVELAQYRGLLSSADRRERETAAEALGFLDTPLSVEYLIPMLSIDNLEVAGIEALARHPCNESRSAILRMLTHRDSSVVGAALLAIDQMGIHLPRTEVYKLLSSDNPAIQWTALDWLSRRPEKQDLPSITPLTSSPNQAVRELARKYAGSFTGK